MKTSGLVRLSTVDFPGRLAAVVFTAGCDLDCFYCHNRPLLGADAPDMPLADIVAFLEKRRGTLDGVVVTGGEPTLQPDLPAFLRLLRDMGYAIKLDTNGCRPDVLEDLLRGGSPALADYVAMDIKAPLDRYGEVTKTNSDGQRILRSISLIMGSGVDYEFRTTAVRSLLGPQEIEEIGRLIPGARRFVLQKFVPTKTLDRNYLNEPTYSDGELKAIVGKLGSIVEKVTQR